jgi:ADP-heptose:LPS heptosyltransferase
LSLESPATQPAPVDARNVLVLRFGPLAGFLHGLAAAKAIRAYHVRARITLLTIPEFETLAKACPYFDSVETDGRPGDAGALARMIQRLRKAKYDMIYDLEGTAETNRYFQLMRPFPPKWSGPADSASHRFADPTGSLHPLDRLARQLGEAGIGPPDGYAIGAAPLPDLSWVRPALRNTPRLRPSHFGLSGAFVLLAPAGADKPPALRWPAAQYAGLARLIAARGLIPVVIGAQEERGVGAEIAGSDPHIKNLVGRADAFQQIALGEIANFAVGEDTGLMHLAAAAGAPVLVFMPRSADPDRTGPRGPAGVTVLRVDSFPNLAPEDVDKALASLGAYNARPTA